MPLACTYPSARALAMSRYRAVARRTAATTASGAVGAGEATATLTAARARTTAMRTVRMATQYTECGSMAVHRGRLPDCRWARRPAHALRAGDRAGRRQRRLHRHPHRAPPRRPAGVCPPPRPYARARHPHRAALRDHLDHEPHAPALRRARPRLLRPGPDPARRRAVPDLQVD